MTGPWIFMGVDRSHFSAKLRPALRYKQLHHVEYPPDMELIRSRTGVTFVPVLITPEDEMLQDTTDIIDVLEARIPEPRLIPEGPDRVLCRLFELYADEFFPTVSMRTRWAYPDNEAEMRRAFAAFSGTLERGNATADLMSSYLPMLGVTADTIPAIDAHTDDILQALCAHFTQHPYLLGERLSLADCALMGPLYAHLYLDRVTRKRLYEDAIEVCMWIERCNRPVPEAMAGWFDGRYPDTLRAVLNLIGQDALPMMLALEAAFTGWAREQASPGQELPRGTGLYSSRLRDVPIQAGVRAYVPWKLQRLRNDHGALSEDAQQRARDGLSDAACEAVLVAPDNACRVTKRNFQLFVDD